MQRPRDGERSSHPQLAWVRKPRSSCHPGSPRERERVLRRARGWGGGQSSDKPGAEGSRQVPAALPLHTCPGPSGGCERNVEPPTLFGKSGDSRNTCILTRIPTLFKLVADAVRFERHQCLAVWVKACVLVAPSTCGLMTG